ncbi:hypothetical protein FRX31_028219 [Thalictrum thalictroides]|uniref:Uncharacterized protein n=1 Tax=Thalictrum thalictroides TaxID=46969 RepID=A0A7J6VDA7_THATH|nr:hypothetical protein FRX31_028219 [Thalictrum thalictroides]
MTAHGILLAFSNNKIGGVNMISILLDHQLGAITSLQYQEKLGGVFIYLHSHLGAFSFAFIHIRGRFHMPSFTLGGVSSFNSINL